MNTERKSLLVRADFVIGRGQPGARPGERLVYRRWRRVLVDALPRLLGCARRGARVEHVRLHDGTDEGHFSAWLRIPTRRRPNRRRARRLGARLRDRLVAALAPVGGEVLKVGVRRCRARSELLPLFPPAGSARQNGAAVVSEGVLPLVTLTEVGGQSA
jgi:hypothetical protein